jgi:uncharacterized protein YaiL (DUF2058 family)
MDMLLSAGKVTQEEADRVKEFVANNQVELSETNQPSLQAAKKPKLAPKKYEERAAACVNAVGKKIFQLMVRSQGGQKTAAARLDNACLIDII